MHHPTAGGGSQLGTDGEICRGDVIHGLGGLTLQDDQRIFSTSSTSPNPMRTCAMSSCSGEKKHAQFLMQALLNGQLKLLCTVAGCLRYTVPTPDMLDCKCD
jgi:hypothetical protein